jgi:hypothetical protein
MAVWLAIGRIDDWILYNYLFHGDSPRKTFSLSLYIIYCFR